MSFIYNLHKLLFSPQKCPICARYYKNSQICEDCKNTLRFIYEPFCIICEKESLEGRTHINCYSKTKPEMLITPFYYEGNVRTLILKAKYAGIFSPIKELLNYTFLFKEQFGYNLITSEYEVISIPADKERFKKRGYNLPDIIAKEISNKMKLKYKTNILKKVIATPSLTQQKKKERVKSVKKAYAINIKKEKVSKKILLVDDIITTGATLLECSKILKQAGCNEIICFTLAYKKLR